MSGENYTNTASTATASVPVGAADTTATLASFTGFPSAPFYGMWEKGTASAELVRVTNVAGSVITMTRGQGGTAATSHGAGVTFEHVIPADPLNRFETHQAATNAHGVTGNIVGTSGSQTIQDKTYRGAHTSLFTDALPAGVAASFLSTADNSSARDGFVHNNTAASAARAAFKLTQSGTDRFVVSNTGNVTVTPSTGTGLTVSSGANVSGGLTVATGGLTVTASGLVVSAGGATIAGATAVTGNLSATGTLHANGALDTDSTLVVDGTSTLTGTVTAGAGVAVTGAVTASTVMAATQGITAWGGSPTVLSVSTTAVVTSPTSGHVVYDRSDFQFKRWTGSVWLTIRPLPTSQTQDAAGTFTSITYVETLAGGGLPCSFTFVAPQSGMVMVHNSAFVENNSTVRSYVSWIIRNGAVIGSGTTFLDGSDEKALSNIGADDISATRTTLVTGLTAGNTYNIRQQFKLSSTGPTGNVLYRELTVVPQ